MPSIYSCFPASSHFCDLRILCKIFLICRKMAVVALMFCVCVCVLSAFGQENTSLTHDILFTLHTFFSSLPILCTSKGLILPPVYYWTRNCGRLWCCHREGHAPLMSEWVMQQPLRWKSKENVSGWCLKVLSGLSLERRRMMKMMAGYICFQKYLTSVIIWEGPVWLLHKGVILYENVKQKKQCFICLKVLDLKTHCWHHGLLFKIITLRDFHFISSVFN